MSDGAGRTALVTGASSGIGVAFARLLAARGYDVVLSARRRDRLEALAAELTRAHGVRAVAIPADLSRPDACATLVATLAERGLRIDVLVNNAGYGVPGRYEHTTWQQQDEFLRVLVVAVAELTHRLLPPMLERGWGRVVNVASLAGLLPGVAGHTLYGASKALLVNFSQALSFETRGRGVHVTASCPGFTWSEFHDVTGTRAQVSRMPAFMWLTAEQVARESYDAVMAGAALVIPGRLNRGLAALGRLLPRRLVVAAMQRTSGRYRKA